MKGFFGNLFDMNKDGELNATERFMDFMLFHDLMTADEEEDEEDEEADGWWR